MERLVTGVPVSAQGVPRDEAVAELIVALREYVADWNDHLHGAPNHARHRDLVELVEASSDEEFAELFKESDGVTGATSAGIGNALARPHCGSRLAAEGITAVVLDEDGNIAQYRPDGIFDGTDDRRAEPHP